MDNKIVIVTGAANGIGNAIAHSLNNCGYRVIAVDTDEENGKQLERSTSGKIEFQLLNISHEKEVFNFFSGFNEKFGQLYALINNAGIIRDHMIWKMPSDDFDSVINVNLKGTWLMCKESSKIFKTLGNGRIVNISSRAWLGNKGQTNYSASKAGVVGMTRALALELGKFNVLVNAIAPGLIDTPMTRKLDDKVIQHLINAQPTRTMGKPEDIANTVKFLIDENTGFITGQTLFVDGGKSIGAGI